MDGWEEKNREGWKREIGGERSNRKVIECFGLAIFLGGKIFLDNNMEEKYDSRVIVAQQHQIDGWELM